MNVLITGVTSGIGRALTVKYIEEGHRVIGIARREERLEEIRAEYGEGFSYIRWDLGETHRLRELVGEIEARGIEVDLLINNAGMGSYGEFRETEIERELQMIGINITASTYLTKVYLKKMTEGNRGGIINVASTAAFQRGGPLMAAYYGSKSYTLTLDEGIRGELSQRKDNKVRVMTLCPGPTSTEFIGMEGERSSTAVTTPEEVASECYRGYLEGREIVIPGRINRFSCFISRFIPGKIQRKIIYRIQKNKRP